MESLNYIDLFAGTGGLSEGFIRNGYNPISHIEMDKEATNTLKTRLAYHYLKNDNNIEIYYSYLNNNISRNELWGHIPEHILNSVINEEISSRTISYIFKKTDEQLDSKKVDLIIGGPPCQSYSLVGRSRDSEGMKRDNRNYLFRYYADFIIRYKPKLFVFENVLGLLTAGKGKYLKEMLKLFSDIGYITNYSILNADDYGVLQKRKRIIIIGRRGKRKYKFPNLEKVDNLWNVKEDLFYDLPKLKSGQSLNYVRYNKPNNDYLKQAGIRNGDDYVIQHLTRNHNERDLEIYSIAINKWLNERVRLKYTDLPNRLQTHSNKQVFLDRYKVVDPFGYSHTLVAHISKDGHYYIYPDIYQIRSISVREAARIQSFPDNYFFEGGRTSAFRQIGNAVPPLMAYKLAKSILQLLC